MRGLQPRHARIIEASASDRWLSALTWSRLKPSQRIRAVVVSMPHSAAMDARVSLMTHLSGPTLGPSLRSPSGLEPLPPRNALWRKVIGALSCARVVDNSALTSCYGSLAGVEGARRGLAPRTYKRRRIVTLSRSVMVSRPPSRTRPCSRRTGTARLTRRGSFGRTRNPRCSSRSPSGGCRPRTTRRRASRSAHPRQA